MSPQRPSPSCSAHSRSASSTCHSPNRAIDGYNIDTHEQGNKSRRRNRRRRKTKVSEAVLGGNGPEHTLVFRLRCVSRTELFTKRHTVRTHGCLRARRRCCFLLLPPELVSLSLALCPSGTVSLVHISVELLFVAFILVGWLAHSTKCNTLMELANIPIGRGGCHCQYPRHWCCHVAWYYRVFFSSSLECRRRRLCASVWACGLISTVTATACSPRSSGVASSRLARAGSEPSLDATLPRTAPNGCCPRRSSPAAPPAGRLGRSPASPQAGHIGRLAAACQVLYRRRDAPPPRVPTPLASRAAWRPPSACLRTQLPPSSPPLLGQPLAVRPSGAAPHTGCASAPCVSAQSVTAAPPSMCRRLLRSRASSAG